MMNYLNEDLIEQIVDSVGGNLEYDRNLRKIFWSGINPQFKAMQGVSDQDLIQLQLDLAALNRSGRLADGTIPFEAWLAKAIRHLRIYPQALKVLEEAAEIIRFRDGTEVKVDIVKFPSEIQIEKIELEKTIHQDDMVSFLFLENGYHVGNAVARIKVTRYEGNEVKLLPGKDPCIYLGTGWLLSESLLITNHHVINARSNDEPNANLDEFQRQGASTVAEFDYNTNEQMGINVPVDKLLAYNDKLDYAIFRIPVQANRRPIEVFSEEIILKKDNSIMVNIIQHPLGYAKKVALRNNHIYDASYPRIRYFTDTEAGSSGSPVLNDSWQAIGIHRAHSLVNNVKYLGKETAYINEGTQMGAILADLKDRYDEIWNEIQSKA